MDRLAQDLRYAVRTLLKTPGFTAVCVLCLALGIGVNSTMFSVVDTVAIRPLPFADPDRLVGLHTTNRANGIDTGSVSYPDLQDWQGRTHSFSGMVAFGQRGLTLADGGGDPERFAGAIVSWDLFPTLGIEPILGRQFRSEEDRPGAQPVVLLSYGLWQRRYARDPSIIDARSQSTAESTPLLASCRRGFSFLSRRSYGSRSLPWRMPPPARTGE